MSKADRTIFYFAYGSNADPDRFRERVGDWVSRSSAWLDGHRLRFSSSVQSEGGGGAVIDAYPSSRVAGVVYEITPEQLAAMDREEFDPDRDFSGTGRRVQQTVTTSTGELDVELYTVKDDGGWSAPSERYLSFILRGLRDAGHDEQALAAVRESAQRASDLRSG